MKLSIIIPAYNEEKRIGMTLQKMLLYLVKKKYKWEIFVVNDGSIDKTKDVVLGLENKSISVLDNPGNKGKGYSVRHGFQQATGDWVLFSDADLSTPLDELDTCMRYTDQYPVVIASRNLPMSKLVVKQPWLRSTMGKIFPFFVRTLLLPGIHDSQCGFKLFRKDVAKAIAAQQKLDGFAFDAELLFLAQKRGFPIKEVPVTWANDERSKVRIFMDPLRMLVDIFSVRYWWIMGSYSNKLNK
jgi:dolichyl-phosphate beta-glucosyltransferase